MSNTIIKSMKIYRLTDGSNEAYLIGRHSKSTNESGGFVKSFSTAVATQDDALAYAGDFYIKGIMEGSIVMPGMEESTLQDRVRHFAEHFHDALENAKTIPVVKIEPPMEGSAFSFQTVHWGDGMASIAKNERSFVSISENLSLPRIQAKSSRALFELAKKPTDEPNVVVPLIQDYPCAEWFMSSTPILSQEQLADVLRYGNGDLRLDKTDQRIHDKELAKKVFFGWNNDSGYSNKDRYLMMADELKNDEEFNLNLIRGNWIVLEVVSDTSMKEKFISDKLLMNSLVDENSQDNYLVQGIYNQAHPTLKGDLDFANKCVANDPYCLEVAPECIKDNKDTVILASTKTAWALDYASDRLKDDEETVLECIKHMAGNFRHASERIQEMCKGYDPVKYLESTLMVKDLNTGLTNKTPTNSKRLKI